MLAWSSGPMAGAVASPGRDADANGVAPHEQAHAHGERQGATLPMKCVLYPAVRIFCAIVVIPSLQRRAKQGENSHT
eukprot:6074645-Pleurochrysis_carterae.AAC.1